MNHKALKPIVYLMAAACLTTSCIGSFGLFNKVLDWNKRATGNKFLNALIFILISPAYALCGVADIFVINTIVYAVTTLEDGYEVKGPDGQTVNFTYDKEENTWSMVQDGKKTTLLKIKDNDTAQIYLNDGGTMDVPLNEYGVYSARMAVNGGTYFAFR